LPKYLFINNKQKDPKATYTAVKYMQCSLLVISISCFKQIKQDPTFTQTNQI